MTVMLRRKNASITVEAALIFPMFFFMLAFFMSFFQILSVQMNLRQAAIQTAKAIAENGYMLRYADEISSEKINELLAGGIIEGKLAGLLKNSTAAVLIKELVKEELKKTAFKGSCIKKGFDGISFFGSSLKDENECVFIKMSYTISLSMFIKGEIKANQCICIRNFSGIRVKKAAETTDEEDCGDEYVYVTQTGSVFHRKRSCQSLNISVRSCRFDSLNKSITACESCASNGKPQIFETVYATKYGEVYHLSTVCKSLKRTVKKVLLSEVGDKRKCKLCCIENKE